LKYLDKLDVSTESDRICQKCLNIVKMGRPKNPQLLQSFQPMQLIKPRMKRFPRNRAPLVIASLSPSKPATRLSSGNVLPAGNRSESYQMKIISDSTYVGQKVEVAESSLVYLMSSIPCKCGGNLNHVKTQNHGDRGAYTMQCKTCSLKHKFFTQKDNGLVDVNIPGELKPKELHLATIETVIMSFLSGNSQKSIQYLTAGLSGEVKRSTSERYTSYVAAAIEPLAAEHFKAQRQEFKTKLNSKKWRATFDMGIN
jgi:hypothetical protein